MFQYAALERNNTTEPLEGRKKCRLALEAAVLQTSTAAPTFTQLEEIQFLTAQMQCGTTASALELIHN